MTVQLTDKTRNAFCKCDLTQKFKKKKKRRKSVLVILVTLML